MSQPTPFQNASDKGFYYKFVALVESTLAEVIWLNLNMLLIHWQKDKDDVQKLIDLLFRICQ